MTLARKLSWGPRASVISFLDSKKKERGISELRGMHANLLVSHREEHGLLGHV